MPSAPINGSINLSAIGNVVIDARGYQGYSFDMNIASENAEGHIYIYNQNTPPDEDSNLRNPTATFEISAGTFQNGMTSQTIDSAYLTVADYCIVAWDWDSGTGTLEVIGSQKTNY